MIIEIEIDLERVFAISNVKIHLFDFVFLVGFLLKNVWIYNKILKYKVPRYLHFCRFKRLICGIRMGYISCDLSNNSMGHGAYLIIGQWSTNLFYQPMNPMLHIFRLILPLLNPSI